MPGHVWRGRSNMLDLSRAPPRRTPHAWRGATVPAVTCSRRRQVKKQGRGRDLCRTPFLHLITRVANSALYEHPLVSPQVMHFKQVPLRTSVNCLQFWQGSPS